MPRKVQIAPVGFEYDRVIEGVINHPCNIIYLLKSFIEIEKVSAPDKELIEIANEFVVKLNDHFNNSKICTPIVREAEIITLERIVEELCSIIKDEIEKNNAEEIWINVSTSNKLFVSAAMYVGSFRPDIIKLFYINASKYTINELLSNKKKEEIKNRYIEFGMTYKEDDKSYKDIEVPLFPIETFHPIKKIILKTLRKLIIESNTNEIKYMKLLEELGEESKDKTIKMKYGHHIQVLKAKHLLTEKVHGRERKYALTQTGQILALIFSYFN